MGFISAQNLYLESSQNGYQKMQIKNPNVNQRRRGI